MTLPHPTGIDARLLAVSGAALFALTSCGGSADSTTSDATSRSSAKAGGEKESNAIDKPTSSPTTMEEVGERLGVKIVQKAVLVEATKKVKKYPDNEAGQAALTAAAARGCKAIQDAETGHRARNALRAWAANEALKDKDAKVVLIAALVSVCPEAEKLLSTG